MTFRKLMDTGDPLTEEDHRLIDDLGDPPLDAMGNTIWAGNLAAVLTRIACRRVMVTEAFTNWYRLVLLGLDRISSTHPRSVRAEAIKELQEQAGLKKVNPSASRQLPVRAGRSLRATSRVLRRDEVPGSLSEFLQAAEEDGGDSPGRGSVGPNGEEVS